MSNIFDLFKLIEKKEDVSDSGSISWIVVGLGNPGVEYAKTRHNIGFMTVDRLSEKLGFKVNRAKFKALTGECEIGGKKVLIMKPQTFMNKSGEAVREAMDFYKIPIQNILVIYDDISLSPGKMRIRLKGSAGGHNGIKSIIEHLSSNEFPRIKLGVGAKPHPDYDLADWVLGNIESADMDNTKKSIDNACEALPYVIEGKTEQAMGLFNGL